jgi:hypothetical protein
MVVFATTLALAGLVALVGSVIMRSASTLDSGAGASVAGETACESTVCAMNQQQDGTAGLEPAPELPREWRGHRKPHTFDHMYRR